MESKIRVEGIYDQRTLKHLKLSGVKDFYFDFSPKSFNFIQEHIFLDLLLKLIDSTDRIFLHFNRSNDPMIKKLANDIQNLGFSFENIIFEIDEWSIDLLPKDFPYLYVLNYSHDVELLKTINSNFSGFYFDFNSLEDLHRKNLINNYANNFHTRFHSFLNEKKMLILRIDWQSNLLISALDLFDFNLISLPINSNIEVCYRNVDLKKITTEMEILKKNSYKYLSF